MATYEIQVSQTWVYNKASMTSKTVGYLSNGDTVTGDAETEDDGSSWVCITKAKTANSSNGSLKGKYLPLSSTDGTTIAKKTKNTETTSTEDEDDDTSAEASAEPEYIDDAFTVQYGKYYTDNSEYLSELEDGLRVADLRGVLGMPHQFLPMTDPRIDGTTSESSFGRIYAERIVTRIPLLLMTPGTPSYLSSASKEQKTTITEALLGAISTAELNSLLDGDSMKYYSLKYAYTEYFYYVNAMLRSAAYFLEIQNEKIDGEKLGTMNWLYTNTNSGSDNSDVFGHQGLAKFLGPYAGCIAFYVDPGETVDDSFSNSTTQSQLASGLNSLSDSGRELNFLIGNVGGMAGLSLVDETGGTDINKIIGDFTKSLSTTLGEGNIFSNVLSKANTILAGGRIVFPEIWSDSSFGRSYSCTMKLVSPAGDKLSVFLNILVPMYHLIAFALPRQSESQSYFSPFLIRAFCQGAFNVDMGIMDSLSITRGAQCEWTVDGLPTVCNISFSIKDMYSELFMSKASDAYDQSILTNISELDYIANSCGVNVNDQEVMRTVRMAASLGFVGNIKDRIQIGIFGNVAQYFNQQLENIFGVF